MQQEIKQVSCLVLQKCVSAILLYYFAEFIKAEDNQFIYTFLCFYLFERLISFNHLISYLQLRCPEMLLILLLNLVQLDDIYFMIRRQKYVRYKTDGIYVQSLLKGYFSYPLYSIAIEWSQDHMSYLFIILQTILLTVIFSLIFYTIARGYNIYFRFTNNQEILSFIKAYILGIIHFISYFWLLQITFQLDNFGYCFLAVEISLIIIYSRYIYLLLNPVYKNMKYRYFICIAFIFKEFLHIVIDPRHLSEVKTNLENRKYGYFVYDRATQFSFIMKVFLLISYAVLFKTFDTNTEFYTFYVILLIVSIISTILIALNIISNQVLPILFGRSYMEFYSVESFINYKGNYFSQKYNDKLQTIIIFSFDLEDKQKQIFFKQFLFSYSNCQIFFHLSRRLNSSGKYWQTLNLTDVDDILSIIGEQRILPQIQSVYFTQKHYENIYSIYSKLAENNMGVHFLSIQDDEQLQILNLQLYLSVKQKCVQFTAFKKFIEEEQTMNPQIVSYDFYDIYSE